MSHWRKAFLPMEAPRTALALGVVVALIVACGSVAYVYSRASVEYDACHTACGDDVVLVSFSAHCGGRQGKYYAKPEAH